MPSTSSKKTKNELTKALAEIIAETNGISLLETLDLLLASPPKKLSKTAVKQLQQFFDMLQEFQIDSTPIEKLLAHPVADALFEYFRLFPLSYREEHTHLTGALDIDYIYPRLQEALKGAAGEEIRNTIKQVYGVSAGQLRSKTAVGNMLRIQAHEGFDEYLNKLVLPKLLLTSRKAHADAAYYMAKQMYEQFNVGGIRLKFTFSRQNTSGAAAETIHGADDLSAEDVVLGLFDGFKKFQKENPEFNFILSPSFRKEPNYFDSTEFESKGDHVMHQVNELLALLDEYPELQKHMTEIDTVGNERDFFRKQHYFEVQPAFRKLQFRGFQIRSHHGETWHIFRHGIQSVDNAMNIWHIDALEHGVAMGVNPNYYFHRLYQKVLELNTRGHAIDPDSHEGRELRDMQWREHEVVLEKLLHGDKLTQKETIQFTKIKFHTAREVEHYQHDVLNRIIDKRVSLVALPSSNLKLTARFGDYKEHPFSWWEKKGVNLGIGTDNYVALGTNFISEMLVLLFTDPRNFKITKLLMVATGERRRPYMSSVLWSHHKRLNHLD